MSIKKVNDGNVVEHYSVGAVAVNAVILLAGIIGIALKAIVAGGTESVAITGRWKVTKTAGTAWTQFQLIYWDVATSKFVTTITPYPAGCAAIAAGSADTEGEILLNFTPATHANVLNNDAAAVAPDADNDVAEGYSVGSRWTDTTADKTYFCQDITAATAVWVEVSEV